MEDTKDQQISERLRDLISKKLGEKIKNYSCVMCGTKSWNLEPYIVPLLLSKDISVRLGGQALPLVPLTCNNCGNTHFFNLVILGLSEEIVEKKGGKDE